MTVTDTAQQKELEKNIWKFGVHLITHKRTYMTFLTIFLLTMPNSTAQTIGLLTLVGQLVGFIFEVPSGYISDRIGHKQALVLARISLVLSTACYIFADNIIWFFVGAILLSIGQAFISGTSTAFMHNTLTALGKDDQYAHIIGRLKSLGFAVPIIFIILLPILAETSFRIAFMVALLIDLVGLIVTLSMKNPPITKNFSIEEVGIKNIKSTLKEFIQVGWLPFAMVTAIVFGLSFGATAGFKNPYQELLGFSLSILGILWAVSRVFISLTLLGNGWIHRTFSFKQFIGLRTSIYALSFIGIGLISNMWVVAALFILGNTAMWGLGSASTQYFLGFIKLSDSKATLLSIKSLMSKLTSAGAGFLMGVMVISTSFAEAYFIFGISLAIMALVAIALLPKDYKSFE